MTEPLKDNQRLPGRFSAASKKPVETRSFVVMVDTLHAGSDAAAVCSFSGRDVVFEFVNKTKAAIGWWGGNNVSEITVHDFYGAHRYYPHEKSDPAAAVDYIAGRAAKSSVSPHFVVITGDDIAKTRHIATKITNLLKDNPAVTLDIIVQSPSGAVDGLTEKLMNIFPRQLKLHVVKNAVEFSAALKNAADRHATTTPKTDLAPKLQ